MTKVRLLNGPCDPRDVTMSVTLDATEIRIRPVPFDCDDVYELTDRFIDGWTVQAATALYVKTEGSREQRKQYRQALARVGMTRAFGVKAHAPRIH